MNPDRYNDSLKSQMRLDSIDYIAANSIIE